MKRINSEYSQEKEAYKDQNIECPHRKLTSKSFIEVIGTESILLRIYMH